MRDSKAIGKKTWSFFKIFAFFILNQWLVIGMGIVCLLAYFFPHVASHGGVIRAEYTILYGAVAVIFLISGMSIPKEKLFTHILNWRLHVLVQGISYLFIPALVYALVRLIDAADKIDGNNGNNQNNNINNDSNNNDHDNNNINNINGNKNYMSGHIDRTVLAGYILLSCLPTTISSNVVMTRMAGGDDAAALVEVLIANIMGPFVTPGWTTTLMPKLPAFETWGEENGNVSSIYANVFKELSLSVILPLVLGQFLRWIWPKQVARVLQKFRLSKVSSVCLIALVW